MAPAMLVWVASGEEWIRGRVEAHDGEQLVVSTAKGQMRVPAAHAHLVEEQEVEVSVLLQL